MLNDVVGEAGNALFLCAGAGCSDSRGGDSHSLEDGSKDQGGTGRECT